MSKPSSPKLELVVVLVIVSLVVARVFLFQEFWSAYEWTASVGVAAIVFSLGAACNLAIAHWYREKFWKWVRTHEPEVQTPSMFEERVRQILSILLCSFCLYGAFAPKSEDNPADAEKTILWEDPDRGVRNWYTKEEFKEIEYELDPELVRPPKLKPWHFSLKYNAFAAFAGLCGLFYSVKVVVETMQFYNANRRPSFYNEEFD